MHGALTQLVAAEFGGSAVGDDRQGAIRHAPFVPGRPQRPKAPVSGSLIERGEDPHPVEQQTRREKALARPLLAGAPQAAAALRVTQDRDAALGGLLR